MKTLQGKHYNHRSFPKFLWSEKSSRSPHPERERSTQFESLMVLGPAHARGINFVGTVNTLRSVKVGGFEWYEILGMILYGIGMGGFSHSGMRHWREKDSGWDKCRRLFILAVATILWLPICLFIFPKAFIDGVKHAMKRRGNKDES